MNNLLLPNFTKYLFYGFAIYSSLSPILYWMVDPIFSHGHKIFFYGMILVMVINLMRNFVLIKDGLVVFLIFYSVFLIVLGLSINELNRATFGHLQALLLPIIGINFGFFLAKYKPEVLSKIYEGAYNLGLLLSFIIVCYFFLYQFSYITYFGASSLLFVPIFWAFLEKKWLIFFLFVTVLILTGKRSATLAILAVIIISLFKDIGIKKFISIIGLGASLGFFFIFFEGGEMDLFKRYKIIFEALTSEEINLKKLDVATSGRINDFIGVVIEIEKKPIFWLTGKGIGALFTVIIPSGTWVTHYSHFTPISYVFLGGGILFLAVYGKLFILFIYCMKNINNFYCMFFIYYFVTSLIGGAIYFSDPFIWIFVGVVIYQRKYIIKNRNLNKTILN